MKLNQLTVGPIVGETTQNRTRIWGRGEAHVIDDHPRRCFGAIRHRKHGTSSWSRIQIIKMNPNFDLTGLAILDRLAPETYYEYQMGFFFSEGEMGEVEFRNSDWKDVSEGHFLTASGNDKKPRTLVIGSCRYLLKTFLGTFFDNRGDKTFRSILKQINNGTEIHQLIMMGDQIYADDLNVFNQDKTIVQFYQRYRDAFSQKYLRKLMSQIPTYMTLDDHEIEDNWPSNANEQDWKTLFPNAIHAYQTYQLSHSPTIPVRGRRLVGTLNRLWYKYSDGCCDIFVTDSRTERYYNPDGESGILGPEQIRALKRWLKDGSGRVKIIVTSVPFVPDSASDESQDKWAGFQKQRIELLEHIERHQIKKVVFFSGDVHASLSIELISPSRLKIVSVVSSAFFWPYPHPSSSHFRTTGTIDGGRAGKFRLANSSRVVGDDNFTKINISPNKIEVEVFERKGKRRTGKVHRF
jgi:alkaline phosphatase D